VKTVGGDVPPRTYRTRRGTTSCYWARLSGFGGTLDEILANSNWSGPEVVTILSTDKGFQSQRCGVWSADLSPVTKGLNEPFGEGTYIVGTDISPGTWRSDGAGSLCYWSRMSGFTGSLGEIIANSNASGPVVITIAATDKGFRSARCGTWSRA
jgi:hypothetical protein